MPQRSRIFGAVDSLFGYDLFVSYSRRDGAPYAHALAERLEALNFSCFLDRDELPAGQPLTRSLRRALRRSTALVVVNTGQARTSSFVALEVEHFAATGRPIIPIVWSGDPGGVPWKIVQDRDLIWITEGEGVQSPSDETIAAIERSVRVTRRRTLATRTMLGAAAAMLLLTVTASVTGWRATVAQRLANTAQSAAAREGQRATEASALALSRKAEADRATAAANERRELLVIESLARLATAGNTPPETAILLASESIHRAEAARRGDRAVSDHALRQAIARAGGLPLLDLSFAAEMHREVQSTYVTRNGRWLAIGMIESPRRHLALYDLHRPDAGMIRRLTAPQSDPPGVYSTIIDLDRVVVTENASFAAGNATSGDEVVVWPEPVRSSRTKIADAPGLNHLLELSDDGHRWCVDKVVYEGTGRAVLRLAENDSDELVALSRDGRWVVSRAGRLFRLDGKPATPPVAIMELRARHLPVVEDSSEGWQPPKERVAVKVDEYQFTPDSRWVVTFGLAVEMWDLRRGFAHQAVRLRLDDDYGEITTTAISADGSRIFVGGKDFAPVVVDVRSGRARGTMVRLPKKRPAVAAATPRPRNTVSSAAFSPDGRWLAVADVDTYLWDLSAPRPVAQPRHILRGSGNAVVTTLTFSPNGRWLAAGGGTSRLWDLSMPDPSIAPVTLTTLDFLGDRFAFSGDSRWLVSIGVTSDSDTPVAEHPVTYRCWPLERREMLRVARRLAPRTLSEAEWKTLFPDAAYLVR